MTRFVPSVPSAAYALAALAAPTPAADAAQASFTPVPQGSYLNSCMAVAYVGGNPKLLTARCRPKAADTAAAQSRLYLYGCRPGSIVNEDGRLRCTFDQALHDEQIGRAAFAAAGPIVLGRTLTVADMQRFAGWGMANGVHRDELASGGLQFSDAADVLRAWLPGASAAEQSAVVRAAYAQVMGPSVIDVSDPAYLAGIRAGKTWYAAIVADLRTKKPAAAPATATAPPPPIH